MDRKSEIRIKRRWQSGEPGYLEVLERLKKETEESAKGKGFFSYEEALIHEIAAVLMPADREKKHRVIVEYDPVEETVEWIVTEADE